MSDSLQIIRESVTLPTDPFSQEVLRKEVDVWWTRLDLRSKLAAHLLMTIKVDE